jgi:serine/threonine-protein kinase RsbW
MPLEINLSLCLPRDGLSVPIIRHICSYALDEVGVRRQCKNDISLALTEACTNVVDHAATDGNEYEVKISINDERCAIRVKDRGAGFDVESDRTPTDGMAESGRGLDLMHELVDNVQFTARPEAGLIVLLEKQLDFDEDHPVGQTLAAS